jgi:hypothetical protein
MSDRLALWAAKLNELEIGRFVPDGNAIIYSGISREEGEIEIIRSDRDGVRYSVLFFDNTWGWTDPIPRFILFSLPEPNPAANSVAFPYSYSSSPTNISYSSSPPNIFFEERLLETWLLTAAVGTAIGWRLLGRKHILSLSLTHGVFISKPYAHTSPYKWEINIPFFSINTNPANYDVILVILFFGKEPHQWWDYRLKFRPRDLVSLGPEGISRLITLATL